MLTELHEGHPGITRMKRLARSYLWWPGLDSELETKVKNCLSCQENWHLPAEAPLHPWEYPTKPWSRLHLDFAGPFMGQTFLIIVDSYSKWIYATHGLPDVIVTDNGGSCTSSEFVNYMHVNGIRNRTTTPWYPSSNGCAERAVQIFKESMKKMKGGTTEEKLQFFYFPTGQHHKVQHNYHLVNS